MKTQKIKNLIYCVNELLHNVYNMPCMATICNGYGMNAKVSQCSLYGSLLNMMV